MATNTDQPGSQSPHGSDWLLPYLEHLRGHSSRLLEAGCGPGFDAAWLTDAGFRVVAFDRMPVARAVANAPGAALLRADARWLPLRNGVFDAVVAALSLHYLPWDETLAAFIEVRRVLRTGGAFLFRVNATDDFYHGAGAGEEIEPNFYRTSASLYSETKRFFDEESVRAALDGRFEVESLKHTAIQRNENPKRIWECLARAL